MSIYSINILSGGLSARLQKAEMQKYRNMIFLVPIYDKSLIFNVHIPVLYEHIFFTYFVRQSVHQATKGRNVKYINAIFSTPNQTNNHFLLCTFISNIRIYSINNFISQATKGNNEKTWKCDFSTPILIYGISYIFLIISNSFSTYWCYYPCFNVHAISPSKNEIQFWTYMCYFVRYMRVSFFRVYLSINLQNVFHIASNNIALKLLSLLPT